jgi:hypothetical protein
MVEYQYLNPTNQLVAAQDAPVRVLLLSFVVMRQETATREIT